MATELRDYRIVEGSVHRFVEEWCAGIAPLRRQMGFTIDGAWTVEDESRFVWLLTHPGDWEAFGTADRSYYASPERVALDPDPARLIEEQRIVRLSAVQLP
jgi:hypothetical protein